MVQSVAFQREFRFELFTAQITEMMLLAAVPVHVGLQVTPIAARVATHGAGVRLQPLMGPDVLLKVTAVLQEVGVTVRALLCTLHHRSFTSGRYFIWVG